jgi:ribonuclease Z
MSLQGRTEELIVHCPAGHEDGIHAALLVGGDRFPFSLRVEGLEAGNPVRFDGYDIVPFRTDHTAASLGYALVEPARPGRFDVEAARAAGVPEGPMFGRLHRGEDVELPDGRVVRASDLVGAARRGRKVVYSGDTRPSDATRLAAVGADLLVHEATFTRAEQERAEETRHSTAREAGQVAADAKVDRLIITHFSARY